MSAVTAAKSVEIVDEQGALLVAMQGDIDETSAPVVLAEAIDALADRPDEARQVVIDLSAVTFLDSMGIGALVEIRLAACTRGAVVSIRGTPPRIARVLTISGLDEFFDIAVDAHLPRHHGLDGLGNERDSVCGHS